MTLGRRLFAVILLCLGACAIAGAAAAQPDSTATPAPVSPPGEAPPGEAPDASASQGAPAAGNAMNPNLSVIAWLQATAGSKRANIPAFQEKEAEIGLQSVVDPYARADFFLSASENGLDLEEGYLTFTQFPAGLGLKVGKFRNKLGKFNQTHAGETPFTDRPLVAEVFFGEEGLSSTGLSASYLVPIPDQYVNLEVEVTSPPKVDQGGVFARLDDKRGALQYLGRLSAFFDLSDATNLNLSLTGANGPASSPADLGLERGKERLSVVGGEMTVRWKNPRRAIYKSLLWQTEAYLLALQANSDHYIGTVTPPPRATGNRKGIFTLLDYQFDRQFHAGFRFDVTQSPSAAVTGHETGELAFLTFTPSEFMLLSLQGRHVRNFEGGDDWNEFMKVTFNIGPHGAHPF